MEDISHLFQIFAISNISKREEKESQIRQRIYNQMKGKKQRSITSPIASPRQINANRTGRS